jgi:hypothetical protein
VQEHHPILHCHGLYLHQLLAKLICPFFPSFYYCGIIAYVYRCSSWSGVSEEHLMGLSMSACLSHFS